MKSGIYRILIIAVLSMSCQDGVNNMKTEKEFFVENLLAEMTLAEKAGQMTQIGIPAICDQEYWDDVDSLIIDTAKLHKFVGEHFVGSFLGKASYPPSRDEYFRLIKQIQDYSINHTRLGIPVMYGTDAVHGANYTEKSTIFPHQLGLAATWNPELAYKMGEVTSYELRASNTTLNFAPVVDISWNSQWGRIFETFGEDPLLTLKMAAALIRGAQGENLADSTKSAVCLKHWIGYGSPQYGQDRKNALIPERYLRQYYIPPFQASIDAGAKVIMINSGLVNGVPCHINKHLITDVLKEEMGFDGFTISDWGDMYYLTIFHRTAEDMKEAVKQMVLAGLDMCMVPYDLSFTQTLVELVEEGEIPMSRIDDAVKRILSVKYDLGLFENPNTHYKNYEKFGSKAFADESYKAASESVTLLENKNDVLPLKIGKKVLVTGVAAHSLNYLNGPWSRSWSGQDTAYNDNEKATILESIENILGKTNVDYVAGTNFDEDINTKIAVQKAQHADYIVVCLGEIPRTERPSDINHLLLPEVQRNLVKQLKKTGKPIVLVLLQARGRIISDIVDLADGIMMAYYPGHEGGRAIADVLFGNVNPSGKLPFSYQKHPTTPMPYLHSFSDRSDNHGGYTSYDPQWPFGYGLSYSKFEYDSIWVDKARFSAEDSIVVQIQVSNTSDVAGKEVVQLYFRDDFASVESDFERLIAFSKIKIAPKSSQVVKFVLFASDFSFVNQENKSVTEPGSFTLITGDRKQHSLQTQIHYQ